MHGTKTNVAQALGVDLPRLNTYLKGTRPMPDEKIVLLAELCGRDPKEALGAYHWEKYTQDEKKPRASAKIAAAIASALAVLTLALPSRPSLAAPSHNV